MEVHKYNRSDKRDQFDCGQPTLNNYIQRNATKDVKNGACTCFVVKEKDDHVIGYYTLSSNNIPLEDAPLDFQKKIKYPFVPVILLGRLAVDQSQAGKGIGKFLLVDALKRSLQVSIDHIGAVAVVVDPIDDSAKMFYLKYGFIELPDSGKMFLSMKAIANAFAQ